MPSPFKLVVVALSCLAGLAASHSFQPEAYLRHVKYLASDELKGRGNGTPELDQAADYIAAQFQASGLQAAGENGSFFQKFSLTTGSQLGPGNKLTLSFGHSSYAARIYRDFVPFTTGEKASLSGDLVFAGYGITAPESNYDDYKDFDVTDKIVLVLTHQPREKDSVSPFNKEITLYGHDNTKAQNAKYRNARAILIVQDPANHDDASGDLPNPAHGAQVDELGICALRITRNLAQRLLDSQRKSLLELQKQIDATLAPQSFALTGVQARVEMDITRIRKDVRNVVAWLPGTDLADECVILGAHFDHLGHGGRNSMSPQLVGQIHNGADDNASGTAGLIELAAALAIDKAARKRSYLFIAFAGEELGLHGSAYFTKHPTRPLEKAIAMLNMDMIGRNRANQIIVGGIGTSPLFAELVKNAAAESGIEVKTTQSAYGSSDHTSFYLKNMPVLFFFSGLHADYHRPSDDWEKIDAPGATRILSMVYTIATRLNTQNTRPQFTRVDEPMTTGAVRGGGSGYGAYFGSIPDMTYELKGVRFADIRPNSPAAKSGLRGGDVLVKFAGKEVRNLDDFTYMLRTHKPGETVEVVVLRDGKPKTAQVKLEVRR